MTDLSVSSPAKSGKKQNLSDDGAFGYYYHVMLNIDDDDLDIYEYRLVGHYRRVCGASVNGSCYESIETTARITKIGVNRLRKIRQSLEDKGIIKIERSRGSTYKITLVDRMRKNIERFVDTRKDTPHEIVTPSRNRDHSPHEIVTTPLTKSLGKERTISKKEPSKNKKGTSAEQIPHFGQLFDVAAKLYVPEGGSINGMGGWIGEFVKMLLEVRRELTPDELKRFIDHWRAKDKFASDYRKREKIQAAFGAWLNSQPKATEESFLVDHPDYPGLKITPFKRELILKEKAEIEAEYGGKR